VPRLELQSARRLVLSNAAAAARGAASGARGGNHADDVSTQAERGGEP